LAAVFDELGGFFNKSYVASKSINIDQAYSAQ
jgi:hypothetical protein